MADHTTALCHRTASGLVVVEYLDHMKELLYLGQRMLVKQQQGASFPRFQSAMFLFLTRLDHGQWEYAF